MVLVMAFFTLSSYDEINAWQGFRAAFPLSRRNLVIGRYVALLCVALLACVFAFAVTEFLIQAAVRRPLLWLVEAFGPETQQGISVWSNPPEIVLAAALLGVMAALIALSFTLPLVARFGMTRAVRFAPMVALVVVALLALLLADVWDFAWLGRASTWLSADTNVAFFQIICVTVVLVLVFYAASAFVSVKLYEKREF